MIIIAGLGNPGDKYENTRHNVGFEFLDTLQKKWGLPDFEFSKKFNAEISKGKFDEKDVLLLKPQTFMNLSGESISSAMNFYSLSPEDLLIIHDDLDIALGKYKLAEDSSSAGHNGVKDIIEKLGTQNFKRIRIGVRPEEECIRDASSFVLQKFKEDEIEKINEIQGEIIKETEEILAK